MHEYSVRVMGYYARDGVQLFLDSFDVAPE